MNGRKFNVRGLLAVLMIMALLPVPFPVYADSSVEAVDYIVRYKDCEAAMMDDSSVPFDVVDGRELKKLIREDALEWYEEDGDAILFETGSETGYSGSLMSDYYEEEQWNLELINAEPAFRRNYLGQGIRVGVVDSGVNPHEDFGDRLQKGRNYSPDVETYPEKAKETGDEYGHGTRVAGLIAAAGKSGYIGAAPGAEIVPLKCTDGKNVKISAICRAIYGGIDDYDCDILNLSLGVKTEYESLKEAVDYAEEHNVVIVSAVGNGGESTQYYPARYDSVIGVGTVDRSGSLYSRSNHHDSVFLTAPGVMVRSTNFNGGYSESTGCSFAIPQVSAAAAVMMGLDDSLTPEDIREILSETAFDRGAEGYDEYYGYGILNIGGCVARLEGGTSDETDPAQPSDPDDPPDNSDPQDPDDEWNPLDDSGEENPGQQTDSPDPQDGSVTPAQPDRPEPTVPDSPADPQKPSGQPKPAKPSSPTIPPNTPEPSDSPGQPGQQEPPDNGNTPVVPDEPVCPKDGSCPMTAFSDLDRTVWYHDGIHFVLEQGIMNGYEDGTFRPDYGTSRAMIVTMLWRMEGSPKVGVNIEFKDVEAGRWYTEAVRWAASEKIVNGFSATAFGPDDKVSREQLAAILWRYAGYKGEETGVEGTDPLGRYLDTEQIASWALEAMRWAVSTGLVRGLDDGHLSPVTGAERAQVATMLMRYCQKTD